VTEQAEAAGRQGRGEAERLVQLIASGAMSQALSVAAELRIADVLADGPKRSDEIADATGCQAPSLHRLMRALASLDLCSEREDGSFALTATGSLLRSDAVDSFRSVAIWWGRYRWPVWGHLLHSLKTGESSWKLVSQTAGFEHLSRDAEVAEVFNQAMAGLTRIVSGAIVRAYDFSGVKRIVDVGGGYGELLAAILGAYPAMRGVLFDLAHAIEGARIHLEKTGVIDRCEFATGDFFESVPGGAEAYLLKTVIHDWDDERSGAILRNCRQAAGRDGRLLIVEQIMPERMEPSWPHRHVAARDLNMLVLLGGRERTASEFRALLEAAGLSVKRTVPTALGYCVIEAVPA